MHQETQRIIYSLPTKGISKFYFRGASFADMDWADWEAVVDGFQARITEWYFERMAGNDSSYVDLCSLCALIDLFTHYTHRQTCHGPDNYKEFLRRLHPILGTKLSKPINVTRCVGQNLRPTTLYDFADVFYVGVRCSLHHHGDLASYAGMSGTGKLAYEVPEAVRSLCGRQTCSVVIFDPGPLKEMLQSWLDEYTNDLRLRPRSTQAQLFRSKFLEDFGIAIGNA